MPRWPGLPVCNSLSLQQQTVTRSTCRKHSALAQKVEQFRTRPVPKTIPIQHAPTPAPASSPRPDPFTILAPELSHLRGGLLNLIGSAHPGLNEIAQYYFLHPSDQLRPLLVLLFSRATNGLGKNWGQKQWAGECEAASSRSEDLDSPLKSPDVLKDWHPNMPEHTASFESVFQLQTPRPHLIPPPPPPPSITVARMASPPLLLPSQMRLARIVEMIHLASRLHDDVSDTHNKSGFGNKLSILGGDFLLGRASAALSRLGDSEVVELIVSVIPNLAEGEIMRMQEVRTPDLGILPGPTTANEAWDVYLRKTYLKTATLMAKGARAAVVLGGCREGEIWKEVAYAYGRYMGIAFQLVEDSLDFGTGATGLQPGLVTGPALYAWDEHPGLKPLIQRNFANEGDLDLAVDYVRRSSGIERTQTLAQDYADKAREVIQLLPDSDAKTALEVLTELIVKRTW